jgi:pyrimidine-nucleoside phosphorylase
VIEAIETLKGNGPPDLLELCLSLGSLALLKARKCDSELQARELLSDLIESGKALENLRTLIKAQGGDTNVIEDYALMPTAKHQFAFIPEGGTAKRWVKHLDGRIVAEACKLMGAGREKKNDPINLAVGVVLHAKVGSVLEPGQPAATVHADSLEQFEAACKKLNQAYTFSSEPVSVPPIIKL